MNLKLIPAIMAGIVVASAAGLAAAAPVLTVSAFSPLTADGAETEVAVNDANIFAPLQAPFLGAGYRITFAVSSDQGLVQGFRSGSHAVPVAGVTASGAPTYLTGDFGSSQTIAVTASGNYFSTGMGGTITISFFQTESAFAALWGSIDVGNDLKFYQSGVLTGELTGAQVQAATAGFAGNGYQGVGGSAYVLVNNLGFDTVVADSSVTSFEFTNVGVVGVPFTGSNSTFLASPVPEPASLALLGAGLLGVATVVRRKACDHLSPGCSL